MSLKQAVSFLNYAIFSWHRNGHGVHSPYLFSMVTNAFRQARIKKNYTQEELLRRNLLSDKTQIKVIDAGAGSKKLGDIRTVYSITRNSAIRPKYGRLLASIVQWSSANEILELGTSVGMGSLYLSKHAKGQVTTIDACSETQSIAKQISSAVRDNIVYLNGTFTEILPQLASQKKKYDLIYIDGNHTFEGTVQNFELIYPLIHEQTIVIFDDINWSPEMQKAWSTIGKDSRVKANIDLWQLGIIVFRPEMTKESMIIRY